MKRRRKVYQKREDFGIIFRGRFPFNKSHRFKFSEFSLVEWNVSIVQSCHVMVGRKRTSETLSTTKADHLNLH